MYIQNHDCSFHTVSTILIWACLTVDLIKYNRDLNNMDFLP